jgi:hypothetical protein
MAIRVDLSAYAMCLFPREIKVILLSSRKR